MKRLLSNFFIILTCAVLICLPISSTKIEASAVVEPEDMGYVLYQGIMKNKYNMYDGLNAVYQYYYTDTSGLASSESSSLATKYSSLVTALNENNICNELSLEDLCKEDENKPGKMKLIGSLATLKITYKGDIILETANDVYVDNLRIYYILADHQGESHLFCDNSGAICNGARNISSGGNWRYSTLSGTMFYSSQDDIELAFKKQEFDGGAAIYSGFNIFDKMDHFYNEDLLLKKGIYVATSMRIVSDDVTYYLNEYLINENYFYSVGNTSKDVNKYQAIVDTAPTVYNGVYSGLYALSSVAPLVAPVNSDDDSTDSQSYKEIMGFIENTLRPILLVVVGIMFVIVGTSTGVTIVKSSDEPEVRRAAIKRFIGLFIGAFVIYMILIFYKPILEAFQRFLR